MNRLGLRLGRPERVLAVLAAGTFLLWVLQSAVPSLAPYRRFALALLLILGGLVGMVRLVGAGQWLARKVLWRVRHRMVAVFFFVGVLPISLGALLVLWGVLLLMGPLLAYVVGSQFRTEAERLESAAGLLHRQLHDEPPAERKAAIERLHAYAAEDFPGLAIVAEFDGTRTSHPVGALPGAIPAEAGALLGLVRQGESLYLAAAAGGSPPDGRVALAVPLTEALVRDIMAGIGLIGVSLAVAGDLGPDALPDFVEPAGEASGLADTSGIPPPRHPLDWQIRWPVQAEFVDWGSGRVLSTVYPLFTRTSALWATIFADQAEGSFRLFSFLGICLAIAFAANLLVSLFIATALTRTLTGAVNDLYVGTERVDAGDFSYRIPVRGSDQISDLSRAFNAMTGSLEGLIEESKRRQQLEAEIKIAREVQARLFPAHAPELAGLEILGICRPARSVSGDFFDYVDLEDGCLAISFGDVSGKGISAALVMASLHSIIRTQLVLLQRAASQPLDRSAAQVVERANRQLCDETAPEKFSTLFFGAYDSRSGTLAYSNAGHPPPLLLRNGGLTPLEVNGMIVGVFPEAEYSATNLALEPGDLLVAYTDGLTEPENGSGEEFGEQRLRTTLRERADSPSRELIEGVMNDVKAWTGALTLQDDMTMLVVRRR